jgi:class 3 adenylate cyclase
VTHVVLPWARDEFLRTSVRPFDPQDGGAKRWEPIFERALESASSVRELGQMYRPESAVGLQYTTEVAAGIALLTAQAARLDVQPVALWDGRDGLPGGTGEFVSFWRTRLKREPVIIPFSPDQARRDGPVQIRSVRRTEQSTIRQEVKSMLFADIVGYSKLSEHVIPEYIEHFLRRLAQLTTGSRHAPICVNTWGDAIYAVFDYGTAAGNFALEIVQMIRDREADWLRLGLYWESAGPDGPVKHPLNIRVGLHTGPTFSHYDPVVSRLGFTGSEVSRAARIEPIARPGEAYVSEEFAALVELAAETERNSPHAQPDENGFTCEYAGSMHLAKDYPGLYRIYRLLPRIDLHIEPLARVVHERYCKDAAARGETLATNPLLRRWEELPEDARNANRAQVADSPRKLRTLGYKLSSLHGIDPRSVDIPPGTLEELAIGEHDRWSRERQRQGWTFAPTRDNARKHHPLLVPWEELSEVEREKDRAAVRNAITLVAEAGLRLIAI